MVNLPTSRSILYSTFERLFSTIELIKMWKKWKILFPNMSFMWKTLCVSEYEENNLMRKTLLKIIICNKTPVQ